MKLLATQAIAAKALLLISACGQGGSSAPGFATAPEEAHRFIVPSAIAEEVGRTPDVEVSCIDLIGLMCEVEWTGNDIWDDAIIFRSTVDDFSTAVEIGRVWAAQPFIFDRDVVAGTIYYYWVFFEDRSGQRSPLSSSASACAADFGQSCAQAPPPPTSVTDDEDRLPAPVVLPFQRAVPEGRYQAIQQPRLATEARQAPVYQDGLHLFVGIDQGAGTLAGMEAAGTSSVQSSSLVITPDGASLVNIDSTTRTTVSDRGEFTVRHARQTDRSNSSAAQLQGYLEQAAQVEQVTTGAPAVIRFSDPPVVQFGGVATAEDADRLLRAVQLVNAALPLEWRMDIQTGVPSEQTDPATHGTIYVDFIPGTAYGSHGSWGEATTTYSQADGSIPYARIEISKAYRSLGELGATYVLAHELIHALGMGHVGSSQQSIMRPTVDTEAEGLPLSLLYPIDREALRALYERMQPGDAADSFGAWSGDATYLLGNSDQAAFGAVWRNGYAEPWAYGYLPKTDLVDNLDLFGTVRWDGLLLGFTSNAEPVAGDASLGVDLSDLTGTADFTGLEVWATGAGPGATGMGTRWGDGDLAYGIAVTGNTFVQTGGDDGLLTGAFFGEAHEGMGGTVERDDLTAAFGGTRD